MQARLKVDQQKESARAQQMLAYTGGDNMPLAYVLQNIFERSSETDAAEFLNAIPIAIGRDNKDLTRVIWAFLAETLRALPPQKDNLQAVIDPVIAGMDLLVAGETWLVATEASRNANDEAYESWAFSEPAYAAEVADWAAQAAAQIADPIFVATAAKAAAFLAEDAAWQAGAGAAEVRRQRDSILRLMSEAPVLQRPT